MSHCRRMTQVQVLTHLTGFAFSFCNFPKSCAHIVQYFKYCILRIFPGPIVSQAISARIFAVDTTISPKMTLR